MKTLTDIKKEITTGRMIRIIKAPQGHADAATAGQWTPVIEAKKTLFTVKRTRNGAPVIVYVEYPKASQATIHDDKTFTFKYSDDCEITYELD